MMQFEVDAIDGGLRGRGLRAGALHEAAAAGCSLADEAAATLFLAGIAAREVRRLGGPVLWASTRRDLYAPGLAQAGLAAGDLIYAHARDDAALLAVVEDAIRDGTPTAVVGEVGRLPMVASRRLQLAAADADLPVLLLRRRRRRGDDPLAEPTAAWTRWRVASAPSERLVVAGVGRARWFVELVRQRGGPGFSLIVEGCDETGRLAVPAALGRRAVEAAGALHAAAA
ncbi:MAG: protein ImuA [Sphingomonas sp.]|nr:MAG: protein ImuA [Sphingomonas sp.]